MNKNIKHTNKLIHESSPYLLQHAHNPVDWLPWSDDIFERAEQENKLVLISIGYSACHWCHVMEHESFEDESVAELMNQYFINVKVDREERPDVDQVYMTAVQLMTQRGGWPLNCITLPDGRPIYGGTYFQKEQWKYVLNSLQHTWKNSPEKAYDYAEKLVEGIVQSDYITKPASINEFSTEKLHEIIIRWQRNFDQNEGGAFQAPKFPLPNNYQFLLRYGLQYQHDEVLKNVELTLDKMAMGGIYDQIGGGFYRYSVDALWKVPHFEKMLYDNAQMLSLYAFAYQHFKKERYLKVITQTIDWLDREMLNDEKSYFSALDADSEGEEGKYYCWKENELKEILGNNFHWAASYYNINDKGYWEEGKFILLNSETDENFALKMNWTLEELNKKVDAVNQVLLAKRASRIRPGLDDKTLTSWNAMLLKGLCDVYMATNDEKVLQKATNILEWIKTNQLTEELQLFRTRKNKHSKINGFLEDYAHVIAAFIRYYEVTFNRDVLELAKNLCDKTIQLFMDSKRKMFYFTDENHQLIARKMELNDNVIPASNSVMAENLWKLSKLYQDDEYFQLSKQMLANVYDGMENYGSGYSNWANLMMNFTNPYYEITISGKNYFKELQQLQANYLPHVLFVGGVNELPILKDKSQVTHDIEISACSNDGCLIPTNSSKSAFEQIKLKTMFILFICLLSGFVNAQMLNNIEGNAFTDKPFFNQSFIKSNKIKSLDGNFVYKKSGEVMRETKFHYVYQFDTLGRLASSFETRTDDGTSDTTKNIYVYNQNNELIEHIKDDGAGRTSTIYGFDSLNRIISEEKTRFYSDSTGDHQILLNKETMTYAVYDGQTKKTIYNSYQLPYLEIVSYYNQLGYLTKKTETQLMTYTTFTTHCEYDEKGYLSCVMKQKDNDSIPIEKTTFSYDLNGNLAEKKYFKDSKFITEIELLYNEQSKLLKYVITRDVATEFMMILGFKSVQFYE